jgi:hypothetical protein
MNKLGEKIIDAIEGQENVFIGLFCDVISTVKIM